MRKTGVKKKPKKQFLLLLCNLCIWNREMQINYQFMEIKFKELFFSKWLYQEALPVPIAFHFTVQGNKVIPCFLRSPIKKMFTNKLFGTAIGLSID
jgi:hypothetical protein